MLEMTHFQVEEDGGLWGALPTLPRGLFRSESLESPRGGGYCRAPSVRVRGFWGRIWTHLFAMHNRDTWLDKGMSIP